MLSQSLDSLGFLDDAVGTVDIFGPGAQKAIGTRMRALLSNQQGRVRLENAVNSIDETARSLGARFDDDVKDLVMFADALDERFGAVARTSLAGQVEQAVTQAVRQGAGDLVRDRAASAVGRGVEKLRGINDFSAFESMEALLNQ